MTSTMDDILSITGIGVESKRPSSPSEQAVKDVNHELTALGRRAVTEVQKFQHWDRSMCDAGLRDRLDVYGGMVGEQRRRMIGLMSTKISPGTGVVVVSRSGLQRFLRLHFHAVLLVSRGNYTKNKCVEFYSRANGTKNRR